MNRRKLHLVDILNIVFLIIVYFRMSKQLSLTLEKKREIALFLRDNPKIPRTEVARIFSNRYDRKIE